MLAKLTAKNQLTLPARVVADFPGIEYFEVETTEDGVLLMPVQIVKVKRPRKELAEHRSTEAVDSDAVPLARRPHPPASEGWVALTVVPQETGQPPPSMIRFPDGSGLAISYWYEIVLRSAEWLAMAGDLLPSRVPVKWGRGHSQYLVSTSPYHPTGRSFDRPKGIARTDFVLDAWGNVRTQLKNAIQLARSCGHDPGEFALRFDP